MDRESGVISTASSALQGGVLIADRYELDTRLGQGGMAEVWRARDRRLNRDVAVKVLLARFGDNPDIRSRFEREALSAARLNHPNAVLVFDSGAHNGRPFLVMECLSGDTLGDELKQGPLADERVREVGRDVLAALAAAHELGIMHRDVKPGNVLLAGKRGVKLADFGIAKSIDGPEDTATGQLLGTIRYLAPERLEGRRATPASDLYSLGVVLYEALTGGPPFQGDTPVAMLRAMREGRAALVQDVRPEADAALAAAIDRALEPDPDARWPDARAMSEALFSVSTDPAPTVAVNLPGEHDGHTQVLTVPAPTDDSVTHSVFAGGASGADVAARAHESPGPVERVRHRPSLGWGTREWARAIVFGVLALAVVAAGVAIATNDDNATPGGPAIAGVEGQPTEQDAGAGSGADSGAATDGDNGSGETGSGDSGDVQLDPALDEALDQLDEAIG